MSEADAIHSQTREKMDAAVKALQSNFNRIRTGRAHSSILDAVQVEYYGNNTPLAQVASMAVLDARTLSVTPWEKQMVPAVEKAIASADLGLNPVSAGSVIRVPMPPLTEESRKQCIRQARAEAEQARVSVRNARRDANNRARDLARDKQLSDDEERRLHERIQKLTDEYIARIEQRQAAKEADLSEI